MGKSERAVEGRRSVATKKNLQTTAPIAKALSPKEKLKIKTKATDDAWYDAAFKRFSISQNRIDMRRDYLATLRPPSKLELL